EMELPDLGLIVMQDAETGEQLFVDTHDARFRRNFAEAAARREAALRGSLTEAGVDCLELATDDDLVDALMRFTVLRKRRSQLAAGVTLPVRRNSGFAIRDSQTRDECRGCGCERASYESPVSRPDASS